MPRLVRLSVRYEVESGHVISTERTETPLVDLTDEEFLAYLTAGAGPYMRMAGLTEEAMDNARIQAV